jgi:hypothetical protein
MQGLALPVIELEHTSRLPVRVPTTLVATLGALSANVEGVNTPEVRDRSSSLAAHDELRCPICRFASSRPEPVSEHITVAIFDVSERTPPIEDNVSGHFRDLLSPPARAPPIS